MPDKPLAQAVEACLVRCQQNPELHTAPKPDIFIARCHLCGTARNLANRRLVEKGTWANIMCSFCKVNRKASKWLCECGKPWHTCSIHRSHGLASDKPSTKQPKQALSQAKPTKSQLGHTSTATKRKLPLRRGVGKASIAKRASIGELQQASSSHSHVSSDSSKAGPTTNRPPCQRSARVQPLATQCSKVDPQKQCSRTPHTAFPSGRGSKRKSQVQPERVVAARSQTSAEVLVPTLLRRLPGLAITGRPPDASGQPSGQAS